MPSPVIDTLYYISALLALGLGFMIAPAQLAARGVLRTVSGSNSLRSHGPSIVLGVGLGAAVAVFVVGGLFGAHLIFLVPLLVLLACLAVIDFEWRWLPIEWCGVIALLGASQALLADGIAPALWGAAVGGGLLFALRQTYLWIRDVEALGLGDVWLAAALGTIVGPERIVWLIGAAAALGLIFYILCRSARDRQMGVAFGAQMALATPIILSF